MDRVARVLDGQARAAGQLMRDIDDGMLAGREIRTLQAHYGISLCGTVFKTHTPEDRERKYQKAIRIAERLAVIGCSPQDNLPYFNAADHKANGAERSSA